MPVPSAGISVAIAWLPSILSKRARSTFRILPRRGSTAWLARLRACLALPPAESPSTMKISHLEGSRSWQSASLPGREAPSSAPLRRGGVRRLRGAVRCALAAGELARLARGFAGGGGFDHLAHHHPRFGGMGFEPGAQLIDD